MKIAIYKDMFANNCGADIADKNQSLLVDAFADVADEFPDWQVHIYGRGKPKDETVLLKRISAKGLKNRIFMKGYADLSDNLSKTCILDNWELLLKYAYVKKADRRKLWC